MEAEADFDQKDNGHARPWRGHHRWQLYASPAENRVLPGRAQPVPFRGITRSWPPIA
jgi:hypothetical protein